MTWNILGFGRNNDATESGANIAEHSTSENSGLDGARNAAYSASETSIAGQTAPGFGYQSKPSDLEGAQWQDKSGTLYPEGTQFWRDEPGSIKSGKHRGLPTGDVNHLRLPDGTTLQQGPLRAVSGAQSRWTAELPGGAKLFAIQRYANYADEQPKVDLMFRPQDRSGLIDVTRTADGAKLNPRDLEDGTGQFKFDLQTGDLDKLVALRDQFPIVPNPKELSIAEQLTLDLLKMPK